MLRRAALPLAAVVLAAPVAACSGEEPAAGGHTHGSGTGIVSQPVGDGTGATGVGYALTDVSLPRRPGRTGEVRLRIEHAGTAQTAFVPEQTKKLHLYVVRRDLAVFRHLHPTMAEDGTWSARVTLPTGGDYRVIGEFVAEDAGGNGDHLVLGETVTVPGPATEVEPVDDPVVTVEVAQTPAPGSEGRLRLVVRDAEDRPVRLGTFLGTYAHVTGFHEESGSMVHLHPMADPEVTEDGSELVFHSEIERPGDYRVFVQVRVDGYVHTVPVEMTVG